MIRIPSSIAMRRHLVASVCCGVLVAGGAMAGAVVFAHLVAGIVTGERPRTLAQWAPELAILVTAWTVRVVGQWLQASLGQRGATAAIAEWNQRILAGVSALAPRDLADVHDEAAALTTRGLDGLRAHLTRYVPAAVLATLLTPAALVAMLCNDVQSAVIVAIALPLIPLFMVLIGVMTRDRSEAALRAIATLQSRTLDLVAGIPTLRALGRTGGAAERIAELGATHRRSALATLRIAFLSSLVMELLATLGVALVAVDVGLRLVFGDIGLAAALTALLLAPEVFWPLRRVGAEFHAAVDGRTAADAAARLVASTGSVAAAGSTAGADASIRLTGVGVAGRDGMAPSDLTLEARPGEVTVLTGPNGAGKSTTLQLILGLTPPAAGRVLVGGVEVTELDRGWWWAQVAWVPQRPMLVPGTILDNLELFGALPDLDDACRATGFDDVLAGLPEGLTTEIGLGGSGLSLGQRQRLALTRALGSRRRVLLLDEPTAHLDHASERRVLSAIAARARDGATVVMVAHRDDVVALGDRVIRIGGEALVHA